VRVPRQTGPILQLVAGQFPKKIKREFSPANREVEFVKGEKAVSSWGSVAVIDTASKTGTEHDGTAVTFFAIERYGSPYPLMILDWTSVGKEERAISVSGYVFQGKVKYTDYAYNKVSTYKQRTKNHMVDQIESFRMADKDKKREYDLLDAFCYGIAISLGNRDGF